MVDGDLEVQAKIKPFLPSAAFGQIVCLVIATERKLENIKRLHGNYVNNPTVSVICLLNTNCSGPHTQKVVGEGAGFSLGLQFYYKTSLMICW